MGFLSGLFGSEEEDPMTGPATPPQLGPKWAGGGSKPSIPNTVRTPDVKSAMTPSVDEDNWEPTAGESFSLDNSGESAYMKESTPKEGVGWKKILPMVLKFALPMLTGAATGGRMGVGAGLAGALAGATGAMKGLGKDQETAAKQAEETRWHDVLGGVKNRQAGSGEMSARAKMLLAEKKGSGGGVGSDMELKLLAGPEGKMEAAARSRGGTPVDDLDEAKGLALQYGLITPDQFDDDDDAAAQAAQKIIDYTNRSVKVKNSIVGRGGIKVGAAPMTASAPTQTATKRAWSYEK